MILYAPYIFYIYNLSKEVVTMFKKRLIEIALSALSALIVAAKSVIKFIGCIGKMKREPAQA